nr:hypothetical protein [Tanacetum cinerariifolium]
MASSYTSLEIIQDTNNPSVFTLYLNRTTRHNALSLAFFNEFSRALSSLDQNPEVSVIVLSGRGKHFCAGIDLAALNSISSHVPSDRGRSGEKQLRQIKMMQRQTLLRPGIDLAALNSISSVVPSDRGRSGEKQLRQIKMIQEAVSAIEKCRKVVVVAVHGGIDIITACDVRYCSIRVLACSTNKIGDIGHVGWGQDHMGRLGRGLGYCSSMCVYAQESWGKG